MTELPPKRRMILCAGLQSGGTTLISWCFLQRQDTDGVLDMENSIIRVSFERANAPILWVKMTVGAFRWLDVCQTYQDLGWHPEPLLIVRDARAAYSSLIRKRYGFNGTTAEEPPLRTRFRRFLRDWELFIENKWPIIRYEDFVTDHRHVLLNACQQLALSWDEGMVSWPKALDALAYVGTHNETFTSSLGMGSLTAALRKEKAQLRADDLPGSELEWLEDAFAAYNQFHRYPLKLTSADRDHGSQRMPPPCFEGSSRHQRLEEVQQLRRQLVLQELAPWIPRESTVVLVGQDLAGIESDLAWHTFPFLEREGQYWGLPSNDDMAISELERLRQMGAGFIVFLPSALWWLESYAGFQRHLRSCFHSVVENDCIVLFGLQT